MNQNYYHKTTIGDTFEYCGFYNKEQNKLYDISYKLRNSFLNIDYEDKSYKEKSDLLKEFNNKISELVTEHVNDSIDDLKKLAGDYKSDIDERDIYEDIMNNKKSLTYKYEYSSNDINNIFAYFLYGEDYLYEIALNVVTEYGEKIGKSLIDTDEKNKLINEINNNKEHYIHKRKEIVESLKNGDYVNVHVYINKNNVDFDFKYDASALEQCWDTSYLSTYNMQASDRRDFEKLFGRNSDFYYEEIYKIEYRGKTIYIDNNFNKEIKEESIEL